MLVESTASALVILNILRQMHQTPPLLLEFPSNSVGEDSAQKGNRRDDELDSVTERNIAHEDIASRRREKSSHRPLGSDKTRRNPGYTTRSLSAASENVMGCGWEVQRLMAKHHGFIPVAGELRRDCSMKCPSPPPRDFAGGRGDFLKAG